MTGQRGQVLPFLALYLVLLCALIGVNGERLLTGNIKIERQRLADSLALLAIHEQVRALNAIAALNQTLVLIRQRKALFTASVGAILACAASGTLSCFAPARRALSVSRRFQKKIKRLEEQVVRQQDEIKSWGESAPAALLKRFRRTDLQAYLYPESAVVLRLRRKEAPRGPYVWNGRPPRLTVVLGTPATRSPFSPFLAVGNLNDFRPDLWTLSEASVESRDLRRMDVKGRLVPIRQHRAALGGASRALAGIGTVPRPQEIEYALVH